MSDLYKQKIVDHYKNPRNFGRLEKFTHTSKVENLSCGDVLEVWMDVDDSGTIKDVRFNGEGCVIALASASMLSEKLKDKSSTEILSYDRNVIVDMMGISMQPARLKCALMALEAVQKSLQTSKT